MTANLQLTVRQAARVMSISERSVYSARRILRSGRIDLVEAVEQGRMSINAAIQILDGPRRVDGLAALARAWGAASEEERATFLEAVHSP